jgi:hypothetical protein
LEGFILWVEGDGENVAGKKGVKTRVSSYCVVGLALSTGSCFSKWMISMYEDRVIFLLGTTTSIIIFLFFEGQEFPFQGGLISFSSQGVPRSTSLEGCVEPISPKLYVDVVVSRATSPSTIYGGGFVGISHA